MMHITFTNFLGRIENYTVLINGLMNLRRGVKGARATEMGITRGSFLYISKNWHKTRIRHWDNIIEGIDNMVDHMLESVSEDFDGDDEDDGLQYLWNNNPEWAPVALQQRQQWNELWQTVIYNRNVVVEPWVMTNNFNERSALYAQLSNTIIVLTQRAEEDLCQYACSKMVKLKWKLRDAQDDDTLHAPYVRTCVGHINYNAVE